MIDWETTKYSKWYASHRRFSFTARHCIEMYEDGKPIPDTIFKPFLRSLYCHSKSEEKMFQEIPEKELLFEEHAKIILTKQYSIEEKYALCKSLLIHMKEEEEVLSRTLQST